MLNLSEILMKNHDVDTFDQLLIVVQKEAKESGELYLRIDIKPSYPDTPANWEDKIEGAFAGVHSVSN